MSDGGQLTVEQLHGTRACQADDVIQKKWHSEFLSAVSLLTLLCFNNGLQVQGFFMVQGMEHV